MSFLDTIAVPGCITIFPKKILAQVVIEPNDQVKLIG
jgi:hypothetical protein